MKRLEHGPSGKQFATQEEISRAINTREQGRLFGSGRYGCAVVRFCGDFSQCNDRIDRS